MLGKEPAVILGAIAEVIKAVIPAFIIFGLLKWTPEQVAAVMFVVGVAVSSLTVILTRSNSVSTDTANKQIETALKLPSTATVNEVIQKVADK
jgi:hypothetical protein